LATSVDAVASDCAINRFAVFAVEFATEPAKVIIGFAYVPQFLRDEFQDNDVVQIANDRYIIGEDVFRIAKVNEY